MELICLKTFELLKCSLFYNSSVSLLLVFTGFSRNKSEVVKNLQNIEMLNTRTLCYNVSTKTRNFDKY